MNTLEKFKIKGKVCVITGGAGFLGKKHAQAVLEGEGIPVILDLDQEKIDEALSSFEGEAFGFKADITDKKSLEETKEKILAETGRIDALINNAANNPKVEKTDDSKNWSRFENFPENVWQDDLDVSLKGSFLCSQVFGSYMAEKGEGVILNISSDLGIIAPDQRIYRKEGLKEEEQMKKPVSYSVAKHGLIGLTKYLATYWADKGVRTNAVCFGGVYNNQDEKFLEKLSDLIPLGRMADQEEYKAAILFLISEASSYMTGSTLIIDGGRTCW